MVDFIIQQKRNTAANWASTNPILADGEFGLETDTRMIKFGDGSTVWNSLPYVGAGAAFKYGLYTMSGNQTSNLSVGNHIEFDTSQGSLGGLSTGSGQQKGIITLPVGKTYKITFGTRVWNHSGIGYIELQLYNRTADTATGLKYAAYFGSFVSTDSTLPIHIMTPLVDTDIDVRITLISNVGYIQYTDTWLHIEEYGGY